MVTRHVLNLTASSSPALVAAVGDPEGTRTILAIVVLLVVLGIGLIMLAVWLFKVTRPDDELLAPLEVMGERKWRRADPVWQRRRLDELRPEGAQPLQPSAAPPDFDEAFDAGPAGSGFDDLHDHPPERVDEVPEPAEPAESEAAEGVPDAAPSTSASVASSPSATSPASPANGDRDRTGLPQPTAPTPIGMQRPGFEELPDTELDPEVMAAAMAELDAELGLDPKPGET